MTFLDFLKNGPIADGSPSLKKIGMAILLVVALLLVWPFYVYGIDLVSVVLQGQVIPEKTYYLATNSGGLATLDQFLDAVGQSHKLKLSKARWDGGDEVPHPRELWRPGLSVMIDNEFECRELSDPNARFRRTAFIMTVTRTSFLTSQAFVTDLERDLEARLQKSNEVWQLPERIKCPAGQD